MTESAAAVKGTRELGGLPKGGGDPTPIGRARRFRGPTGPPNLGYDGADGGVPPICLGGPKDLPKLSNSVADPELGGWVGGVVGWWRGAGRSSTAGAR